MNKQDYHEDEKLRVSGERYAGIVVRGSKVLLIHRIKQGREYYVFPGGHRRQGEDPKNVVIREVEEETDIIASNPRLAFKSHDKKLGQFDFYYLCDWVSGEEPKLNGEEKEKNSSEDFYEPMWVEIKEAKKLNILPNIAKYWLIKNL